MNKTYKALMLPQDSYEFECLAEDRQEAEDIVFDEPLYRKNSKWSPGPCEPGNSVVFEKGCPKSILECMVDCLKYPNDFKFIYPLIEELNKTLDLDMFDLKDD